MSIKRFVSAIMFGLLLLGTNSTRAGDSNLCQAAENGDVEAVQRLLAAKAAPVDAADQDGRTPLMLASLKGHETIIRLLLAAGATVKAADQEGWTPLMLASEKGHGAVARLLLAAGAPVNAANQGWTPLMLASLKGHETIVRLLLAAGAPVDAADQDGWTPLILASQNGHKAVARLLLAAGADVNAADQEGWTPLMIASQNGHEDVIRLLLAAGATVNTADHKGLTALMIASQHCHEDVTRLLLAARATVNTADQDGCTPLMIVSQNGHKGVTRLLLAAGATVNTAAQGEEGWTPLMLASQNGHETIVQILLNASSVCNDTQQLGEALQKAAQSGHTAIVQLLLSYCSGLKKTYRYQFKTVKEALKFGRISLAQLILQHIAARVGKSISHWRARSLHKIAFTQDESKFKQLLEEFLAHNNPARKKLWRELNDLVRKDKANHVKFMFDCGLYTGSILKHAIAFTAPKTFALALEYYDEKSLSQIAPLYTDFSHVSDGNYYPAIEAMFNKLIKAQNAEMAQMLVAHSHRNIDLQRLCQETRESLLTKIVSNIATKTTRLWGIRLANRFLSLLEREPVKKHHHTELLKLLAKRGMVKELSNAHQAAIQGSCIDGDNLLTEVRSIIAQRQYAVRELVGGTRDLEQVISEFEGKGL